MKTNIYSLWLVPSGDSYRKFSEIIKKLATQYRSPVFKPHITIFGRFIQSEDKIESLVKLLINNQKPFLIKVTKIGYQDSYTKALFVKAEENKQLTELENRAKEILDIQAPNNYFPHLSLLYGNFTPEIKEKIIQEISRDQTTVLEIDKVILCKLDERVNIWQEVKEFIFN